MTARDDFTEKDKAQLARQVGYLCSFPSCRVATVGSTRDGKGVISIGTAAHICAASPGGPRYDEQMTTAERRSPDNGIWMCRDHGKAIDSDEKAFPAALLRQWKQHALQEAWFRVVRTGDKVAALPATQVSLALRSAAERDLQALRSTERWPKTEVSLLVEIADLAKPVAASALAENGVALQDLILTAPPGMGKTTTLLQFAEGIHLAGGLPLFISLGDWATDSASLLASVLQRAAFSGISETDLRTVAAEPGVVMLLDGWNELDIDAARRARVQIEGLKASLPNLGLMVSTRKQAMDVPFRGAHVALLPLDETLQLEIAIALRGSEGAGLLDEAWRTPGVRELVGIPLYLEALMSLPQGAAFPTTKEAVLSLFVASHEQQHQHADALRLGAGGMQTAYLEGLAALATATANTAVSDSNARRAIATTAHQLTDDGQITIKPQPDAVLGVLVSDHLLTRTEVGPGYAFQHQQFQEWYASHEVERRVLGGVHEPAGRGTLKSEILDLPAWEEAIFFMVERLARGNAVRQKACAEAILAAFEVDPILSAEMVARATDAVWALVEPGIAARVRRWHAPGQADRALRFMLTSGRPEFLDVVWPLITHENEQVSLGALRGTATLRPSILGPSPSIRIRAIEARPRSALLHEFADRGGMGGMDLATEIAMNDPDVDVQVAVIDALAFRRADRHVARILERAGVEARQRIVERRLVDLVQDKSVQEIVASVRSGMPQDAQTPDQRLFALVESGDAEAVANELTDLVSSIDLERLGDPARGMLATTEGPHAKAIAQGVLARMKTGTPLFFGAVDLMIAADLSLEEKWLVDVALSTPAERDDSASAAAAVLGPAATGKLIDALLALAPTIRTDQTSATRYRRLADRLSSAPEVSLLNAVERRSALLEVEQIARLADLLSRRRGERDPRGQTFAPEGIETLQRLIVDWGERLLDAASSRWQRQTLATLVERAPSPRQIDVLQRLLDRELHDLAAARSRAEASKWQDKAAVTEVQTSNVGAYARAFRAIGGKQVVDTVRSYLLDRAFGESAGRIISAEWERANTTPSERRFGLRPDFSNVAERRNRRRLNRLETSEEAEILFAAIDKLMSGAAVVEDIALAIKLATLALRLPHGDRADTVARLLALGDFRTRLGLLQSLVVSGEAIDIERVTEGISATFEAAKAHTWILTDSNAYLLREWLQLLAFTAQLHKVRAVVNGLPAERRAPGFLEDMIAALADVPGQETEDVLFGLANDNDDFHDNRIWHETVFRLGRASAVKRYFEVVVEHGPRGKALDDRLIVRRLASALDAGPALRAQAYACLTTTPDKPGIDMVAGAIAEAPDEDGLLLLVERQIRTGRETLGWRTIERVVTDHIPVDGWQGAYETTPKPAASLRRRLLALTADGSGADIAAQWLEDIDVIRDEHGRPGLEPRHPDLGSGRAWPIITGLNGQCVGG